MGEKVKIDFTFYYEDITYATADNSIIIEPNPADVDLFDTTGVIWSEDGTAFTDTYVGDKIGYKIGGVFAYANVTEKFDNGMIRTDYSGIQVVLSVNDYVFNSTPFAGIRYAYNFVENGNSYNSLVDGEYQQAQVGTADVTNTTPIPMAFTGLLSYQLGNVTIKGEGGFGGGGVLGQFVQQRFTITHNTRITPLFLSDQYNDLLLGVKPSYFDAQKCLNYIAKISLGRSLSDPNGLQEFELPIPLSNVAWRNETFNGGTTNYKITSLIIKDSLGNTVPSLQLDGDSIMEIIVSNTIDSPFVNSSSKFEFGFNYLPESESYYQNNGKNQTRNFLIDSKVHTVNGATSNGDNLGNSLQVIKTVKADYISATQIKITAVINLGADAKATITQGDFYRYNTWVTVENHSLLAINSDKVPLTVQVNSFSKTLITTDLIENEGVSIVFHPNSDTSINYDSETQDIHPLDEIVVNFPFKIDFTDHGESEGIKIAKIQNRIVLKDSLNVQSDILLEENSVSTSNYPIIGGKAQDINYIKDRGYKIPDSIQRNIIIKRDYLLDSGDELYYKIQYPFLVRWEYWEKLNTDTYPSGLFDNTKQHNGYNHFWQRLASVGTFEMYYECIFTIEQNGEQFTQTFNTKFKTDYNYNGNVEWSSTSIKTYNTSNVSLESGGVKYINGNSRTKVVASATKILGSLPAQSKVGFVIWIEPFEGGSPRRASSYYDISNDPNTWFVNNATNRVDVVKTGNVYTGTVYLDNNKIPKNQKFTIYARVFEYYTIEGKKFQNGDRFLFQDGSIYKFQDQ
jgi:hypothetical protein